MFPVFHGRKYREKPKQWGNISSVRSSVMRNAEDPRFLGIAGKDILFAYPFWGLAGTGHDYSQYGSHLTNACLSGIHDLLSMLHKI